MSPAGVSTWPTIGLALRSVAWAVLLPGVVAGYVPWRFFGLAGLVPVAPTPLNLFALAIVGAGAALLIACIWEFAYSGHGTLAPVDAPTELVVRGLYRFVRNPMYLSVTTMLLGEALLARSWSLLLYWLVWFGVVNLFVIGYEEPTLHRRFGGSFEEYVRRVPRWLPTLPTRARSA
jgi:protein-S-isoprenylcysteine O-methyltransferase Ste14